MPPEWVQFIQRHENKPAVMKSRVRDSQPWLLHDAFTVEKNVEIDCPRARTVVLISSERSLNLLEYRKKTLRCNIGFNLHHAVEEPPFPWIGLVSNRFRFIQERHSNEP